MPEQDQNPQPTPNPEVFRGVVTPGHNKPGWNDKVGSEGFKSTDGHTEERPLVDTSGEKTHTFVPLGKIAAEAARKPVIKTTGENTHVAIPATSLENPTDRYLMKGEGGVTVPEGMKSLEPESVGLKDWSVAGDARVGIIINPGSQDSKQADSETFIVFDRVAQRGEDDPERYLVVDNRLLQARNVAGPGVEHPIEKGRNVWTFGPNTTVIIGNTSAPDGPNVIKVLNDSTGIVPLHAEIAFGDESVTTRNLGAGLTGVLVNPLPQTK